MVDLGTLEIGLRLDKGDVQKDIDSIRKDLEKLYGLTEANEIAIKPSVDHKPLDALNKHLDKKVKHLREVKEFFKNNPIEVEFDESGEGKKNKGRGSKGVVPNNNGVKQDDSNWESKLGNVLQQVLDKSIDGGVKELLKGLPGPITNAIANPLVGFLQGFTGGMGNQILQYFLGQHKKKSRQGENNERGFIDGRSNVGHSNILRGQQRVDDLIERYHPSGKNNQTMPDPWDDNEPVPTVEVVGKNKDSAQEEKQRTVVVEEVKEDKTKPQVMSGYSVKGDGTVANVSTQNTFNTLANEVKKLNGKIVPAPAQSLTQGIVGGGLQANNVENLTSAIVALQASIDQLNSNFARFDGNVTGGLATTGASGVEIVSIDDLFDPSPIQMTAEVIGHTSSAIQKLGRGVQSLGTVVGNAIGPIYGMLKGVGDVVSVTIPYFPLLKGGLQTAGTFALGAGAINLLPGGVGGGLVHMAQSGLSPLTGMGASAVSGMVADLVTGLPFGIGSALSANVAGLLAGGAETVANIGGAGLATLLMGKTVQNVASLPFANVDKDRFKSQVMITPAYEPEYVLNAGQDIGNVDTGKGKGKSLKGSSLNQPSLPSSSTQGTLNVGQINAGEVKGEQLALPSKSGGVNYDVAGLDSVKSEQDLVDYLSVQNKVKNEQGKKIQLFEKDGLRRLAQDLASLNNEKIKSNLNREESVGYVTKQDLSQVVSLLAQNPSRYYNPKANVQATVVNPMAETRKQPDVQEAQIAQIKSGATNLQGQFNSAKNLADLQQALKSYENYVKSVQSMRLNLTPTRELNGIVTGLRTSVQKGVIEVAKGIDQGLGNNVTLDTAIAVLQKETPELVGVVKRILGMASPSKVFMEIGRNIVKGLQIGFSGELGNFNNVLKRAFVSFVTQSKQYSEVGAIGDLSNSGKNENPAVVSRVANVEQARLDNTIKLAERIPRKIQNEADIYEASTGKKLDAIPEASLKKPHSLLPSYSYSQESFRSDELEQGILEAREFARRTEDERIAREKEAQRVQRIRERNAQIKANKGVRFNYNARLLSVSPIRDFQTGLAQDFAENVNNIRVAIDSNVKNIQDGISQRYSAIATGIAQNVNSISTAVGQNYGSLKSGIAKEVDKINVGVQGFFAKLASRYQKAREYIEQQNNARQQRKDEANLQKQTDITKGLRFGFNAFVLPSIPITDLQNEIEKETQDLLSGQNNNPFQWFSNWISRVKKANQKVKEIGKRNQQRSQQSQESDVTGSENVFSFEGISNGFSNWVKRVKKASQKAKEIENRAKQRSQQSNNSLESGIEREAQDILKSQNNFLTLLGNNFKKIGHNIKSKIQSSNVYQGISNINSEVDKVKKTFNKNAQNFALGLYASLAVNLSQYGISMPDIKFGGKGKKGFDLGDPDFSLLPTVEQVADSDPLGDMSIEAMLNNAVKSVINKVKSKNKNNVKQVESKEESNIKKSQDIVQRESISFFEKISNGFSRYVKRVKRANQKAKEIENRAKQKAQEIEDANLRLQVIEDLGKQGRLLGDSVVGGREIDKFTIDSEVARRKIAKQPANINYVERFNRDISNARQVVVSWFSNVSKQLGKSISRLKDKEIVDNNVYSEFEDGGFELEIGMPKSLVNYIKRVKRANQKVKEIENRNKQKQQELGGLESEIEKEAQDILAGQGNFFSRLVAGFKGVKGSFDNFLANRRDEKARQAELKQLADEASAKHKIAKKLQSRGRLTGNNAVDISMIDSMYNLGQNVDLIFLVEDLQTAKNNIGNRLKSLREGLNKQTIGLFKTIELFGSINKAFSDNPFYGFVERVGQVGQNILGFDIKASLVRNAKDLLTLGKFFTDIYVQPVTSQLGQEIRNGINGITDGFNKFIIGLSNWWKTTTDNIRQSTNNTANSIGTGFQNKSNEFKQSAEILGRGLADWWTGLGNRVNEAKRNIRDRVDRVRGNATATNQTEQVNDGVLMGMPSPDANYSSESRKNKDFVNYDPQSMLLMDELGTLGVNDFDRAIEILEILVKIDKIWEGELAEIKKYKAQLESSKAIPTDSPETLVSELWDKVENTRKENAKKASQNIPPSPTASYDASLSNRLNAHTGKKFATMERVLNEAVSQGNFDKAIKILRVLAQLDDKYAQELQQVEQLKQFQDKANNFVANRKGDASLSDNSQVKVPFLAHQAKQIQKLEQALNQAVNNLDFDKAIRILKTLSDLDDSYTQELQEVEQLKQYQDKARRFVQNSNVSSQNIPLSPTASYQSETIPDFWDTVQTPIPYDSIANRGRNPKQQAKFKAMEAEASRAIQSKDFDRAIAIISLLVKKDKRYFTTLKKVQEMKGFAEVDSRIDQVTGGVAQAGNVINLPVAGGLEQLNKLKMALERALEMKDFDKAINILQQMGDYDSQFLAQIQELEDAKEKLANSKKPVSFKTGLEDVTSGDSNTLLGKLNNWLRNKFGFSIGGGNVPPTTPPPTATGGNGSVPDESALTRIPNNVHTSGEDPNNWDFLNGKKKFSLMSLNAYGTIPWEKDSDTLQANARRLGRDLTRALKEGLEMDDGVKASIKYKIDQIKAEVAKLKEVERQLQQSKDRIVALEYRQNARGTREETLRNEITALKDSVKTAPVGDRDQIKAQIKAKEMELQGVLNEQVQVEKKIAEERKKAQDLETIANREREEIGKKQKEVRKELDNEIGKDFAVYREMEDRRNKARLKQGEWAVRQKILPDVDENGNPINKDDYINQVAGFGASVVTAFAPMLGLATLIPVVMKLIPTITAVSGAINMLMPFIRTVSANIEKLSTLQNRFNAISTDSNVKGKEFGYVKGLANTLGLSQDVMSTQYTKLYTAARGTKLQGAELKQLFEGVAASVRTLNLTTYESELVFNAYAQILSKGKLSMEELRQQLGEKFPPAMGVFARSLGVSVAELDALTSKGAILSDEVLSKVGRQLKIEYDPIVGSVGDSYVASLNRFQNAVMDANIRLVNEFEGLFIAINNIMTSGIRMVEALYNPIKQFLSTSIIGVTAVLAVGATVITQLPIVGTALEGFSSLVTQTMNRGMTALMPFMAGIGVDMLPFIFGADMKPIEHISYGIWNIVEAMVSLAQVKGEGDNPIGAIFNGIGDMVQGILKALNTLRKALGGPIQVVGLMLMFEQMILLGKMYVIPTLEGIGRSIGNLAQTMWRGLSSGKNWNNMLKDMVPILFSAQGMMKGLVFAGELVAATLLMMFARGDFANPLQDSFVKVKRGIDDLMDAFKPLTELTIEPDVKMPSSKLPSMGLETNWQTLFLGMQDKSVKSDDVIAQAGKFTQPFGGSFADKLFGFINRGTILDELLATTGMLFGNKSSASHIYNTLGAGGGEIAESQRKALESRGLGEFLPANNRETVGLRTTVNQFQFIEDLAKQQQDWITKTGLDSANFANTVATMNEKVKEVTKEQAEPILKDSGLSEAKQDEIRQLKTIEQLDARMMELGGKRSELWQLNTPEALAEIREIDMELRAIEGIRKNVVIEIADATGALDSMKAQYESMIEDIEKTPIPFEIKKKQIAEVQALIDEIDKLKKMLEEEGWYDKIQPLEDVFKRITTEVERTQKAYDKFTIENIEYFNAQKSAVYKSGIGADVLPVVMSQIGLDDTVRKLDAVSFKLAEAEKQAKELSKIAIPAEGSPRSEQLNQLRQDIRQLRQEKAELTSSLDQQDYDLAESQLRRRIAIRDFDRQRQDLAIQIDNAVRQRAIEVRNIVRQQDDLITQNVVNVRNIYESMQDVQIQLDRRAIDLQSQLELARNNISRLQFNIDTGLQFGFGNGIGSRLATISDRLAQINNDYASATGQIKLQELDAEQQALQVARQIRGLKEQAYTLEKTTMKQLEDLANTQDSFVRNQASTWLQITKRVEEMKLQADRMDVEFTDIADTVSNINQTYLDLHANLEKVANDIKSRPITVDDVNSSGLPSDSQIPKIPEIEKSKPEFNTDPTVAFVPNNAKLVFPNGVKPVIQNNNLKVPMGTVMVVGNDQFRMPTGTVIHLPAGSNPVISQGTVNVPKDSSMTLPAGRELEEIKKQSTNTNTNNNNNTFNNTPIVTNTGAIVPPNKNDYAFLYDQINESELRQKRSFRTSYVVEEIAELDNIPYENYLLEILKAQQATIESMQKFYALSPNRWDLPLTAINNVTDKDFKKAQENLNLLQSKLGQEWKFIPDESGQLQGIQASGSIARLLTGNKEYQPNTSYILSLEDFNKALYNLERWLQIEVQGVTKSKPNSSPNQRQPKQQRPGRASLNNFAQLKDEFIQGLTGNGKLNFGLGKLQKEFAQLAMMMDGIGGQLNQRGDLLRGNWLTSPSDKNAVKVIVAQNLPAVPTMKNVTQQQPRGDGSILPKAGMAEPLPAVKPADTGTMTKPENLNVPKVDTKEVEAQAENLNKANQELRDLQILLNRTKLSEALYKKLEGLMQVGKEYYRLGQEMADKITQHVRQMESFNFAFEEMQLTMQGFTPMGAEGKLARMRKTQDVRSKLNGIYDQLLQMQRDFDSNTLALVEQYEGQVRQIMDGFNIPESIYADNRGDSIGLATDMANYLTRLYANELDQGKRKQLAAQQRVLLESIKTLEILKNRLAQVDPKGADYTALKEQALWMEKNIEFMAMSAENLGEVQSRKNVLSEVSRMVEMVGNAFVQGKGSGFYETGIGSLRSARLLNMYAEKEDMLEPTRLKDKLEYFNKVTGKNYNLDDFVKYLESGFAEREKTIKFETSGYNEVKQEFGQLADLVSNLGTQLNQRGEVLMGSSLLANAQAIQAKIQANDMRVNLLRLKNTTELTDEQFNSLNGAINEFERNSLAKIKVDNHPIVSQMVEPFKQMFTGIATIWTDKSKSLWEKVNDIMANFFGGLANNFASVFSNWGTTKLTEKLAQWIPSFGADVSTKALDKATAIALDNAGIKFITAVQMFASAVGMESATNTGGQILGSLVTGAIDIGASAVSTAIPAKAFTKATASSYSLAKDVKIKPWGSFDGGLIKDVINTFDGGLIENYANGGLVEQAQKALARERLMGGGKAILSALTVGEYVIPKNPNKQDIEQAYANVPMLRNMQIENYANGGMVGSTKTANIGSMISNNTKTETRDNSFVSNVYVTANDASSFRKTRYQIEMEEQSRMNRASRRF